MNIRRTSIFAAAVAGIVMISPMTVTAGEQPNLMIVGEDADQDTVPRNSRVFNRVLRAISTEMELKGFKVYDETAATMDITNPARVRRTDAELITVAKRVQSVPIDAITVFQIYASAEQNAYSDIIDLRIRIPGRILHVQTGQSLGSYEVGYGPGDLPPLPVNCNPDCVLEHVGDQAKRIASDVGAVLASKLDAISPARPQGGVVGAPATTTITVAPEAGAVPTTTMRSHECTGLTTAYTLTFRGFAPDEISLIEEYVTAFKGYDHHRPMRTGATEARYWYETCSDIARLNRNMRLMVEQMGVQARIGMVGNRFDVDKIGVPARR